jgi:hypothetical protein
MTLIVYAPFDSPRLRYVLHWVLYERLHLQYTLTHDESTWVHLSIGKENSKAFCIPESGFLRGNSRTFSLEDASLENLHFDFLSAIFSLLARVEEYGTFEADKHGRFPAALSVLSQKSWLKVPVVDIWVEMLRKELNRRFHVQSPRSLFYFHPTYDIDIAYSYLHKGFRRTVGGLLRDVKSGNFRELRERLKTLSGRIRDPYDAFGWLQNLHAQYGLKPTYFMLAAQQPGPFDKNSSPQNPAMKALAQSFALEGRVGIHPSYTTSEKPERIKAERDWLEDIVGPSFFFDSRQHYIRLRFPETYRQLLAEGIRDDYSMGYPDALGFRAGTSYSFNWYDLEQETSTRLRIHPFCFMDTTARDYLGLSAQEAFQQLQELKKNLMATGGILTTVFHNFSLGTAADWPHWRDEYERWIAG